MLNIGKMKHKILIIRGKVTAGKTTISHELARCLPDWIFVDAWKIKEMFEPLDLKDRTPLRTISKKAMTNIMKEVMKQMQINIIVQESSISYLKRYLRKYLREYNYEIYSFFLDVDLDVAIKRDKQREKPTMNVGKDVKTNEEWKKIKAQPEKRDIVINTSDKSVKEIVDFILKKINEKPKKHKQPDLIRKSW